MSNMKYVRRVTHKGKQIWIMDAANRDEEEVLVAWDEATQVKMMEQEGFRALIDARNMPLSPAVLRKMVVIADMIKGDPRFRGAFVGMKGMALSTTTIYAKTRRVNAKFCDTVEEAKDWLVKE